ncbi:MAG: FHA domain-containing protein [Burkholderiaceae bacterium]
MNHALEHLNLVASFPPAIPKNRALIEHMTHDGQTVNTACRMDSSQRSTLIVGRHLDCDIVLDDPHVAARHCQIEFDATGQLHVTDLGSLNGIRLNGERVARAMLDNTGTQTLTLGQSCLRVRLREETLAPEQILSAPVTPIISGAKTPLIEKGAGAWQFCLLALLFLLQSGAETWFTHFDHQRIGFDIATAALTAIAIVAIWTCAWALISRLVVGSPNWTSHACIGMGGYLLTWGAYNLAGAGTFALSLVMSWTLATIVILVSCSFIVLLSHLLVATQLRGLKAIMCAAIVPAIILGLTTTKLYTTNEGAEIAEISNTFLLPPDARLRTPPDVSELLRDARGLASQTSID